MANVVHEPLQLLLDEDAEFTAVIDTPQNGRELPDVLPLPAMWQVATVEGPHRNRALGRHRARRAALPRIAHHMGDVPEHPVVSDDIILFECPDVRVRLRYAGPKPVQMVLAAGKETNGDALDVRRTVESSWGLVLVGPLIPRQRMLVAPRREPTKTSLLSPTRQAPPVV